LALSAIPREVNLQSTSKGQVVVDEEELFGRFGAVGAIIGAIVGLVSGLVTGFHDHGVGGALLYGLGESILGGILGGIAGMLAVYALVLGRNTCRSICALSYILAFMGPWKAVMVLANKTINTDAQTRRFALLFHVGRGER
jgi:polyferredoxin